MTHGQREVPEPYLRRDGTLPMQGDLDMGENSIFDKRITIQSSEQLRIKSIKSVGKISCIFLCY